MLSFKHKIPLKKSGIVPETGFEPARRFQHHHLKVACLPISTPGQIGLQY